MISFSEGAAYRLGAGLCSLVLVLLTGCAGTPEPAPDDAMPAAEVLYFEPIGQGIQARLADTTAVAIRDSLQWAAYQDSLNPIAPFTPVDFDQALVLVAAMPARTGGFSIEFETVELIADTVVASYVVNEPGDDCLTAMGLTTPFQAILVRRTDHPVRFDHRTASYSCEM